MDDLHPLVQGGYVKKYDAFHPELLVVGRLGRAQVDYDHSRPGMEAEGIFRREVLLSQLGTRVYD